MNLQNNFNKQNKNLQDVLKRWDEKILPFLPDYLDELARKTGAIQRKRGLGSASGLLKMLFLYACSNISFRILAAAAYLGYPIFLILHGENISQNPPTFYMKFCISSYHHSFQKQKNLLLER